MSAPPPAGLIHPSGMSGDPARIWLQPECCADPDTGRLWCEHNEPVECPDGQPWTEYRRTINPEPRWHVLIDADDEIVAGGTRGEMEEVMADLVVDWEAGRRDPANTWIPEDQEHGYTLHPVYIGPAVEVEGG